MSVIWIIVILVVAGLILQLFEFVIPSFGMITICACAMFGIALYLGFNEARWLGWTTLGALIVLLPVVLALGFRWLPNSPLVLKNAVPKPDMTTLYHKSVGKVGVAKTDMRPVGRVEVDDETYEAVSSVSWVSAGDRVLVTGSKGQQLIVRPIMESDKA